MGGDESVAPRWKKLSEVVDLNSTILEIGCGTAGYLEYLLKEGLCEECNYTGVDILPEMESINKRKFPRAKFYTLDLLNGDELPEVYNIVSFCGVFNLRTGNGDEYMKELLLKAWQYTDNCMVFNFISSYVNYIDEEMEYHNPSDILKFIIENISNKVEIIHHYQKCDCIVKVYK